MLAPYAANGLFMAEFRDQNFRHTDESLCFGLQSEQPVGSNAVI